MNEALKEVIDYVFNFLKFKKILAFTHNENQKSTHLLLKFNFLKSTAIDKDNQDLTMFTLKK
jgi:[ribosomal protein S5]-alanine N-acetyltransferase